MSAISWLCLGIPRFAHGTDYRYMCRDPKQIKFAPLNRDTEHTAEELMTIYEVRRSHLLAPPVTPADPRSKTVIWVDTSISSGMLPPTPSFTTPKIAFCPCHPSSTRNVSSRSLVIRWPNAYEKDSKIVAGRTKNIFIDTTATDRTKL